ncbi:MAG: MmgE/PrpD family protein [Balneolaceae bacterium]
MIVHQLATFVNEATFEQLSDEAIKQLKIRLLDSLGTAIGAIEGPPIKAIRNMLDHLGGTEMSTLMGGGKTTPDRATLYNSALVRYLDFNDSYLAKGETCHPSDNIGSILAAGETAGLSGKDFLTALAIAYQVQCRLSDEAPVRDKGFDHTTQGAYAVAAGAYMIMIESEGITENADPWRTDVPAQFINEIGLEKLMFEAADPEVFAWYIKNYGPEVNVFVDHSQIVQLETLRRGIWGTKSLWGRVLTYKG